MKVEETRRRVVLSIAFLSIFMTLGFFFLLLAYTGPRWAALVVFLVYVFVMTFMIKTTRRFLRALKQDEGEDNQD